MRGIFGRLETSRSFPNQLIRGLAVNFLLFHKLRIERGVFDIGFK